MTAKEAGGEMERMESEGLSEIPVPARWIREPGADAGSPPAPP